MDKIFERELIGTWPERNNDELERLVRELGYKEAPPKLERFEDHACNRAERRARRWGHSEVAKLQKRQRGWKR